MKWNIIKNYSIYFIYNYIYIRFLDANWNKHRRLSTLFLLLFLFLLSSSSSLPSCDDAMLLVFLAAVPVLTKWQRRSWKNSNRQELIILRLLIFNWYSYYILEIFIHFNLIKEIKVRPLETNEQKRQQRYMIYDIWYDNYISYQLGNGLWRSVNSIRLDIIIIWSIIISYHII